MAAEQVSPEQIVFFLGGHDLEMVTIRDLLAQEAPDRFYDRSGSSFHGSSSRTGDDDRTTVKYPWCHTELRVYRKR